jgi:hypothetical protein
MVSVNPEKISKFTKIFEEIELAKDRGVLSGIKKFHLAILKILSYLKKPEKPDFKALQTVAVRLQVINLNSVSNVHHCLPPSCVSLAPPSPALRAPPRDVTMHVTTTTRTRPPHANVCWCRRPGVTYM